MVGIELKGFDSVGMLQTAAQLAFVCLAELLIKSHGITAAQIHGNISKQDSAASLVHMSLIIYYMDQ